MLKSHEICCAASQGKGPAELKDLEQLLGSIYRFVYVNIRVYIYIHTYVYDDVD